MSDLETALLFQIKATKSRHQLLPMSQHPVVPEREWRFDFAWPEQMLAVEVTHGI